MKRLTHIIAIILAFAATVPANAVTDKEMEQARVIAAQAYLRYANDGSGYLDDLHPKTMAELERGLKPKEKENIKAFKAVAVPKDYRSWDKAKLVEYWGGTAFAAKGLAEKGRTGKLRAKKRINAMTVAAPAAPESKTTPAPAQDKKEAPAPAATQTQTPAAAPAQATAAGETQAQAADSVPRTDAAADAALLAMEEEDEPIQKAKDNTWIYIVILVILVAVVVALVVFASNTMKKSEAAGQRQNAQGRAGGQSRQPDNMAPAPSRAADGAEANALREKFAAKLAEKNNEVYSLNKKIDELNRQNASLKKNLEGLTSEIAMLRTRLAEAAESQKQEEQPQPAARPAMETHPQPQAAQQPQRSQQAQTPLRTIYLGRANAKGIFVRADRTLNIGNSIFRLDTTDGYAGTFRVAEDPTVWEMALLTPRESLSAACVAPELENTDGMQRIVNDSSGTAVFEGGCWKVIRKAKIHYE